MWYLLLKKLPYFAPNYKPGMKAILSEKNIVVVLFVLVLITFSFAREDSKRKMTQIYSAIATGNSVKLLTHTQAKEVLNTAAPLVEQ